MLSKRLWGGGNEPRTEELVAYVSPSCPAPTERENCEQNGWPSPMCSPLTQALPCGLLENMQPKPWQWAARQTDIARGARMAAPE